MQATKVPFKGAISNNFCNGGINKTELSKTNPVTKAYILYLFENNPNLNIDCFPLQLNP